MRDILDPITRWWESGETFGLASAFLTLVASQAGATALGA